MRASPSPQARGISWRVKASSTYASHGLRSLNPQEVEAALDDLLGRGHQREPPLRLRCPEDPVGVVKAVEVAAKIEQVPCDLGRFPLFSRAQDHLGIIGQPFCQLKLLRLTQLPGRD